MRFCLLKADYVNDDLLVKHGDLPEMFELYMASVVDADWDTYEIRFGHYPSDIETYDAIFITGSRYSVNSNLDWVAVAQNFVRSASSASTIIGHCFGHQLIASALGGTVRALPTIPNVGMRAVQYFQRPGWESAIPENMNLLFNHTEQVVDIPVGSKLLAADDYCVNQVVQYAPNILGLQAHPEYSVAYQEALMELNSKLPDAEYVSAQRRNKSKAHNVEAANLTLNFIHSRILNREVIYS